MLDRELLRLGGVKLSLLLVDGVALGWSGLRISGADPRAVSGLWGVVLALCLLAACGLLVVLGGHLAAALHLVNALQPLGRLRQVWAGAIAAGALGLGCVVGATLATGDHRQAGAVLVQGSFIALVVLAFAMILQVPFVVDGSGGFDFKLSWCGFLLGLMIVGGLVAASPRLATGFLLAVWSAPLGHVLFFFFARERVDRCHRTGAGAQTLEEGSLGRTSSLVRATMALPLGGLAVPWWLSLRDRRSRHLGESP